MHSDRILELLARKFGNFASEPELKELEELLKQYPEYEQLVRLFQSIKARNREIPGQSEGEFVEENWEKLQKKMKDLNLTGHYRPSPTPVKRLFSPALRAVAIWGGVVLVALAIWLVAGKGNTQSAMAIQVQQDTVPFGKPERKTLPDGSVVWLNSGSKLRFIKNPSNLTREAYLEGEAYFQVYHDPAHPFIVYAGNISVQALGTEFNVSAYPGDDKVETTLIKGKVQVSMKEKPDQKIILEPNEKLTLKSKVQPDLHKATESMREISYQVEPVALPTSRKELSELAWMQDRLSFHNESFYELSKRMERRYNVHILFRDEALKNESLSGAFVNEHIGKALALLQMTTPFRYQIKLDSVFINK